MTDRETCQDEVDPIQKNIQQHESFVENSINLSLLDPARWGWPAVGDVVDLLTPHEVSVIL
jgi:hypothetical protein